MRPRLCHLRKWADFPGYGFDLQSEKGTKGVTLLKVDFGSPAMVTGLRSGDRIIEVNGNNVESSSHVDVVRRVMARVGSVELLVTDDITSQLYQKKSLSINSYMDNVLVLDCPEEKPGR